MINNKPILLVEDDLVDAMTVKRAFKDLKLTNRLIVTKNGVEALQFLRENDGETPGLILLDINMPKMNGIEFLKIIKKDGPLKKIPTVVLTTSKNEQDKFETYNQSVAGYMIKPVDYLQFVETIRALKMYWMLSELPSGKA